MNGDVALTLIDEVPVIGARYSEKERALAEAKRLVARVSARVHDDNRAAVRVGFVTQDDGRYTLRVFSGDEPVAEVANLDELMLRRFRKAYNARKMFILTCFVEGMDDGPHSLVITDGLGVVIYKPLGALMS